MADLDLASGEERGADPAFERLARVAARALNAPLALIALPDPEGCFQTWSAGCESLLLEVRDGGCFTWKLLPADGRGRDPRTLTASSRGPEVSDQHLSRPVRAGEEERAGVLCIADWEPRAWTQEEMTLLRDLAALVEREIEYCVVRSARQAAVCRLERPERTDSQLAAALRHEFRQPLTVIQGFSELMGEEGLSPQEIREYALEINKEAAHLSGILAKIRDTDERIAECAGPLRSPPLWP